MCYLQLKLFHSPLIIIPTPGPHHHHQSDNPHPSPTETDLAWPMTAILGTRYSDLMGRYQRLEAQSHLPLECSSLSHTAPRSTDHCIKPSRSVQQWVSVCWWSPAEANLHARHRIQPDFTTCLHAHRPVPPHTAQEFGTARSLALVLAAVLPSPHFRDMAKPAQLHVSRGGLLVCTRHPGDCSTAGGSGA